MSVEDLIKRSPMSLLGERGLGKGNLGVLMARAGVGKTTFLVQVGLHYLLQKKPILHVSLVQTIEQVQARYDALLQELVTFGGLEHQEESRAEMARLRMISAFSDEAYFPGRVAQTAEALRQHLGFKPVAIIVDSHDWEHRSLVSNAALLGALRGYAKIIQAEVWVSAQTHRESTGPHPMAIPEPCRAYAELIDAALYLEPHDDHVDLRLLGPKDGREKRSMELEPDSLLPLSLVTSVRDGQKRLPAGAATLLSGGCKGAESYFGACAEKWGLKELNFTFRGRTSERQRNTVVLSDEDLAQGAVSEVYLKAHMHRSYPKTELFRKTMQTIWHQVKTAGEVFVVGVIQDDKTVKGGTGWAAELGRHWNKTVYVYDQERKAWFVWDGETWQVQPEPRIASRRFCGTGTRFLSDDGKDAIEELFNRSFGPAKA